MSALERLDALLTEPAAWLPASAWEDREIKAYVPSGYTVCYGELPRRQQPSGELFRIWAARLLTLLPKPAQDLLANYGDYRWDGGYCADVTTEEARAIAKALDDAGFEQGAYENLRRLEYESAGPTGHAYESDVKVVVIFEPILPHGESPCSASCAI